MTPTKEQHEKARAILGRAPVIHRHYLHFHITEGGLAQALADEAEATRTLLAKEHAAAKVALVEMTAARNAIYVEKEALERDLKGRMVTQTNAEEGRSAIAAKLDAANMQITAIEAALARSAVTNAALRMEVLQREGEVANLRAKINRQDAETSETYAELKAIEKNLRELLGLARDYIDPEVITKHDRRALLTRIEGALAGTPIGLVAARGPTPHFDDLLELAKVIAADPACRHSSHARSVLFPAPAPTPAPQAATQTPPPVAKPIIPLPPGTIFRHYKTGGLYRKLFETAKVLRGDGVGIGGRYVMSVTITTDGPDDQKLAQLYITPVSFGVLVCRIGEDDGWRYVDYPGVVYVALDGDNAGRAFFRSKEQFEGTVGVYKEPRFVELRS